jgi:ProP effector
VGAKVASTNKYAEAAVSELAEEFPAAFTLDPTLVRPLKLGIKDDIYARSGMSHRRVTAALKVYCNSVPYLTVCTEGAVRVDLTGARAGVVTATDAEHAMAARAKIGTKPTGKAASAPRGTQVPKPAMKTRRSPAPAIPSIETSNTGRVASGPRRLSLADLRKAAAARKVGR